MAYIEVRTFVVSSEKNCNGRKALNTQPASRVGSRYVKKKKEAGTEEAIEVSKS